MDRIRAGLTGLAVVFLVTAAAALLFAPDPAQQARVAGAQAADPGEPLAQLGVAPGSEKASQPLPPPPPPVVEAQPSVAPSSDQGFPAGIEVSNPNRTVEI